ncbi:hypothetical protein BDZ91DRAFT_735644 [Kalaharituber pfeilii]|nr:hypothetical protein BDZ91DRAFT_735644 [Kalaharituber pfeilii]
MLGYIHTMRVSPVTWEMLRNGDAAPTGIRRAFFLSSSPFTFIFIFHPSYSLFIHTRLPLPSTFLQLCLSDIGFCTCYTIKQLSLMLSNLLHSTT